MTLALLAQGETEYSSTQAGTPTALAVQRLSQFQGSILQGGSPVATAVGASLTYANNMDPVATIRSDGKIEGYDDGVASATGTIEARFTDSTTLRAAAAAGNPVDLTFGYTRSAHEALTFYLPAVYLPVPKREISGPGGIQARFDFQAAKSGAWMLQATLRNDVAGY